MEGGWKGGGSLRDDRVVGAVLIQRKGEGGREEAVENKGLAAV